MAAAEEKSGSPVLAIAHNGNLSNGRMFPIAEAFGKQIDKEHCETRQCEIAGIAPRANAD